jgi:hypothetical protein
MHTNAASSTGVRDAPAAGPRPTSPPGPEARYMAELSWDGDGWNGCAGTSARDPHSAVTLLGAWTETHWPSPSLPFAALAGAGAPWNPGEWRITYRQGTRFELVSPHESERPRGLILWSEPASQAWASLTIDAGSTRGLGWLTVAADALRSQPRGLAEQLHGEHSALGMPERRSWLSRLATHPAEVRVGPVDEVRIERW